MSDADVAQFLRLVAVGLIPGLLAIALHEAAHGFAAARLGDPTAERLGRVTANPFRHVDPLGTVIVPLLLLATTGTPFGWAKPVPVNPRNLRDPKGGMVLVAAAGPTANLLMAVGWVLAMVLGQGLGQSPGGAREFVVSMSQFGIQFNVLLAVFNLLPIPPLDGGRVLRGLVPEPLGRLLDRVEPWGLILVFALLYFGLLNRVLFPVIQRVTGLLFSLAGTLIR
jgi:Zn-dependent protease